VHGDETDAGFLRAARKLGRVARGIVPSEPHLERDGHLDGADHGLHERQGVREVAHQGAPGRLAGDLAGGTAHIDVDDVGALPFRDPRALGHVARLASDELNHMRLEIAALGAAAHVRPAGDQFGARHHLGDDEARAQRMGEAAKGQIRNPRHRGQEHGVPRHHRCDGERRHRPKPHSRPRKMNIF